MEFNEIIKSRRKELNKTLEQVANDCDVSKATVLRWESGEIKNIRRDKIAKLAKSLNVTPGHLMGWDDIKIGSELNKILISVSKELNKDYTEIKNIYLSDISPISKDNSNLNYENVLNSYIRYYDNKNHYQNDMKFSTIDEAMRFIIKSPTVSAYGGYDLDKMTDDEIIEFANELAEMFKVLAKRHQK